MAVSEGGGSLPGVCRWWGLGPGPRGGQGQPPGLPGSTAPSACPRVCFRSTRAVEASSRFFSPWFCCYPAVYFLKPRMASWWAFKPLCAQLRGPRSPGSEGLFLERQPSDPPGCGLPTRRGRWRQDIGCRLATELSKWSDCGPQNQVKSCSY